MAKGIRITVDKNIRDARPTDFVIDSLAQGSMKVHKIITFKYGGDLTTMSSTLGLSAYIQRYKHGLSYVPAYLSYLYENGTTHITYNDFISVAGDSHFVNVTPSEVIVGFDSSDTGPEYIRVVLFAEKLIDS